MTTTETMFLEIFKQIRKELEGIRRAMEKLTNGAPTATEIPDLETFIEQMEDDEK